MADMILPKRRWPFRGGAGFNLLKPYFSGPAALATAGVLEGLLIVPNKAQAGT
jgi:hypothetical protein